MLRNCFKSDMPALIAIEQAAHIVPWTEETFTLCFDSNYIGWVIESEARIIGFVIVSLTETECHVLNICIDKPYQHKGFGRMLMEHVLNYARGHGAGLIYLEVRKSNYKAISLYRKLKFHLVGERKDYYPADIGKEDAFIFAKSLHEDAINL